MSGAKVRAIRLGAADDVAVVLAPVAAGQAVRVAGLGEAQTLTASEAIPTYHKVALRALDEGRDVIRNGTPIGRATEAIEVGQLVHVHNLVSRRGGAG